MKVYAQWHGGGSYSWGDPDKDLEVFPSLAGAMSQLKDRFTRGNTFRMSFTFADGRIEQDYCPCVDADTSMLVFFSDPRQAHEPYPDRQLTIGPRGGVRSERC